MGSHFFTTTEINNWQADMLAQQTIWTIADLRYFSKFLHFHFYLSNNGRFAQYIDRLIAKMERESIESFPAPAKDEVMNDKEWYSFSHNCSSRLKTEVPRRNGTRLNIEVSKPADRCFSKLPTDWPDKRPNAAILWVGSGGDILIFGHCNRNCPRLNTEEAA